jgi:hypothetical protein
MILIIFFLLHLSSSYADLIFSIHGHSGEADRYYRPVAKEFVLTQSRLLTVDAQPTQDHSGRNSLHISLNCGKTVHKNIYIKKRFCGLTHISFNNSSNSLILYFTEYNPTVVEGDCSGKKFTETVSLNSYCRKNTNNKNLDKELLPSSDSIDR